MQATKKKNQKSHVLNTGKKACEYWQQKALWFAPGGRPLVFLVFVCVVKTGSRYRCGPVPECTCRLPYFFLLISWFLGIFAWNPRPNQLGESTARCLMLLGSDAIANRIFVLFFRWCWHDVFCRRLGACGTSRRPGARTWAWYREFFIMLVGLVP
jgi:hypothetical protein